MTKIEVDDRVYVWIEKAFKNKLADILFSVFFTTEWCHVDILDGWILLNYLSKNIDYLKPSCFTESIHVAHLYEGEVRAHNS